MITTADKYRCALREIGYRRWVYRGRVANGQMKQELADREIALMAAIAEDYRQQLAAEEPSLFPATEVS